MLAAFLSEVLVGAVEGTGEALGLSTAFLGIVLLASVGGVAEGMSAVTHGAQGPLRPVARHQRSAAASSSRCSFRPCLVFASYFVGPHPFQLSFSIGGVGLLFLSVLIGAIVATGGSRQLVQGRAAASPCT